MSVPMSAKESVFHFPSGGWFWIDTHAQRERDALTAELKASLAREDALLRVKVRPPAATRHARTGVRASARQ
jgi:hypothetical protein